MPKNIRLPRAVCSVVASILHGSHTTLDALFVNSGAPLPPPGLSHATKWKEWLFLCGTNPECDTLAVLGNVLEEFMDTEPCNPDEVELWKEQRERVVRVLEENGFRCYRGGRVLPSGAPPEEAFASVTSSGPRKPANIDELLLVLLKNLRRRCIH